MSDFKAKMHQIRFRLGICPRPRWGSLQRSRRPLAGFQGPTSKGREGKGRGVEGKGKDGRGGIREPTSKRGEGRGKVGQGKGEGREGGKGWKGRGKDPLVLAYTPLI